MAFSRGSGSPQVPTLPKGEEIASYATYLEAQKAVDHLSDKEFPVQHVTIVGTDLRMVERVTGRLTYSRVALAGLATGAWFGLFVGLLLSIFAGGNGALFPAIAIGAGFGVLFSVISYAFTGGKRDFTSSSQIVAGSYAILCVAEHAHKARGLLQELGGRQWPPPAPLRPEQADSPAGPVAPPGATQPGAVQPDATPRPDLARPGAPESRPPGAGASEPPTQSPGDAADPYRR